MYTCTVTCSYTTAHIARRTHVLEHSSLNRDVYVLWMENVLIPSGESGRETERLTLDLFVHHQGKVVNLQDPGQLPQVVIQTNLKRGRRIKNAHTHAHQDL